MPSLNATFRIVCSTVLVAALTSLPSRAYALTVENATFAKSITIGDQWVPLHGAALLRWQKLVKVYVAALYLPEQTKPSEALSDIPKRLEISYLVAIKGADFGRAAEQILARNVPGAELAGLRSRIDRLNAVYRNIKPGDRYALTYQPGKGTELSWNKEPLITIEGADFAAAYFGIWLGSKPLDDKVKKALLRKR
jgi:hypothetical protein